MSLKGSRACEQGGKVYASDLSSLLSMATAYGDTQLPADRQHSLKSGTRTWLGSTAPEQAEGPQCQQISPGTGEHHQALAPGQAPTRGFTQGLAC